MKFFFSIFLILSFDIENVLASNFDFSGRLDVDHYQNIREIEQTTSSLYDLQLLTDYRVSDFSSFKSNLNPKFRAKDLSGEVSKFDFDIKELFYIQNQMLWQIRIGKFIERWGKTDIFSPLDVLAGKDQKNFYFSPNQQYMAPNLAVSFSKNLIQKKWKCAKYKVFRRKVKWRSKNGKVVYRFKKIRKCIKKRRALYKSPYSFQVTMLYSPSYDNFPLSTIDTYEIDGSIKEEEKTQIEFASKLTYSRTKYTWSSYFFYGRQRSPFLEVKSLSTPIQLQFKHPEKYMLGFDFEKPFSTWVVRADVAFFKGSQNKFQINDISPYGEASFAFEKRLNQYIRWSYYPSIKHYLSFEESSQVNSSAEYSLVDKSLYTINSTLNNYLKRTQFSSSFRFAYESFSLKHKVSLIYSLNHSLESSFYQFDYIYAYRDNFELGIGANVFEGEDGSYYGLLKDKSSVAGKLTYWF